MVDRARAYYDEQLRGDERKRVYVERKRKLTEQQKFIKEKRKLFYPREKLNLQGISEASTPFSHTFDPKSWELPPPFQKEGFLFSSPRFIERPAEFAYAPFDFRRKYPAGMRSHIREEEEVFHESNRLANSKEIMDYTDDVVAGDDVKLDPTKVSKLDPAKARRATLRALEMDFARRHTSPVADHSEEIAEWVEKEATKMSLI